LLPVFKHSSQPLALGVTLLMVPRCEQFLLMIITSLLLGGSPVVIQPDDMTSVLLDDGIVHHTKIPFGLFKLPLCARVFPNAFQIRKRFIYRVLV
jgi:hypothetical protein